MLVQQHQRYQEVAWYVLCVWGGGREGWASGAADFERVRGPSESIQASRAVGLRVLVRATLVHVFCLFPSVYFAHHGFVSSANGEIDRGLKRPSIPSIWSGPFVSGPTALMPLSSSRKRAIGLLFAQHVTLVQKYRI